MFMLIALHEHRGFRMMFNHLAKLYVYKPGVVFLPLFHENFMFSLVMIIDDNDDDDDCVWPLWGFSACRVQFDAVVLGIFIKLLRWDRAQYASQSEVRGSIDFDLRSAFFQATASVDPKPSPNHDMTVPGKVRSHYRLSTCAPGHPCVRSCQRQSRAASSSDRLGLLEVWHAQSLRVPSLLGAASAGTHTSQAHGEISWGFSYIYM
jgi:hypothetical protein